jgi:GNAT superfamily N-acetyltransferase
MVWRPDVEVSGPERPTVRDIEALNRVFSDSFTDRYRRDGLTGVRVPHLNPLIWRYALEDAGDGAMIWRDAEGQLAAFNIVHRSGAEGWMGPLAVRPDRQGVGIGRLLIQAGIAWLRDHGATTIGLETMPRTVENIGFYSRLGFLPGHLTVTLTRDLPRKGGAVPESLSRESAALLAQLAECRALTERFAPGTDFSRELTLTQDLRIGGTALVRSGPRLTGFGLWHAAPLAAGRPQEEVRVLKLVAEDLPAFDAVLLGVQNAALAEGVRRVGVRCQTVFGEAYSRLIDLGFRVHWTDLRMTLRGYEQPVPNGGVVLSNWEI